MSKAETVYVRLGFSDIVVTKEESEAGTYETPASYLIGYEDEDGNECEEDGTYLDQSIELDDDVRKCHLCDEPTVNKYCENTDCEVNQRDEEPQQCTPDTCRHGH